MFSNLLLNTHCLLAEGMHWDEGRQLLWFVDIDSKELLSLNIDSLVLNSFTMPEKIGWVITKKKSKELILGLKSGIASLDPDSMNKNIKWITNDYPNNNELRLNDAKADSSGCIWAGSLNDTNQEKPEGCLFRLDQSGKIEIIDSNYKVANGPAIDLRNNKLFHTDSLRRSIYSFDINFEKSVLTNKKIWKIFDKDFGFPDGMCFDNDGFLWVAHWGAGLVTKIDNNGSIVDQVQINTPNVTNVCFAGKNRDRLIVTTAQINKDDDLDVDYNSGGSLFEIYDHGTSGMKVFSYQSRKSF